MRLRDERLLEPAAGLGRNLRLAAADVVAHRRVRQVGRVVLVERPRMDRIVVLSAKASR